MEGGLTIVDGSAPAHLDTVRSMFREYEKDIGINLCFQGFEHELATLPGRYASPAGRLYLLMDGESAVGCIALRDITDDLRSRAGPMPQDRSHGLPLSKPSGQAVARLVTCEMKRLYIRTSHRGRGLGRVLAERLIADARGIGYDTMRLDTLDAWLPAVGLYRSLGFKPTERYNDDLDPHTLFMALDLRQGSPG